MQGSLRDEPEKGLARTNCTAPAKLLPTWPGMKTKRQASLPAYNRKGPLARGVPEASHQHVRQGAALSEVRG